MTPQAILSSLDRPLLCSSMHIDVLDDEPFELPDAMSLMDAYSNSGIDFMVDVGKRVAEESTVSSTLSGTFTVLLPTKDIHQHDCPQCTRIGALWPCFDGFG